MNAENITTVYGAFKAAADRWPDRDLLQVLPGTAEIYDIQAESISYQTTMKQVLAVADHYKCVGYQKGMRVALLLENRPEFFVIWLALNKLGISVVPINPDLRVAELEYLIGHSEPALVVAIKKRHDELREAAKAAGVALEIVNPQDSAPPPRDGAIVAEDREGQKREAAVLYTSGTTGNPKGCVLPNTYFLQAGKWYAGVGGVATLTLDGERMITPLPIFHMNAMAYSFMAMVTVGGCLTVLDRFHPRSWWADVAQSKATCLHYLGVMPSILMGVEPKSSDTDHCIKFGFGAGVDPKLQADFEGRFGFPLVEAWAMTETGAGAVIAANTEDRLIGKACLGIPGPDVECRLVDDNHEDVAVDEPGELLVRHAGADPHFGFFSHYYKNPEATAEAWQGGWFHTGDLVRKNEAGQFFFVDRKKNVIRRSGENIAAVEVESILMRHPDIEAAGVTSVRDEIRGDEVFACLKVRSPSQELATQIVTWCLSQMAYYKAPGYIAFIENLPLTATQKIQRAELKKLASELLDRPQTINTTPLKKRQAI